MAHKLCWAFLYAGVLIAQTPPVTPNIGLYLPAHGTYNWDTYYNTNWSSLDTRLGSVRSILDFGAKGDGTVADNATAFQAASTWANAVQGRTLTCPDGTYAYSGGLAFTVPVTFTGRKGCVLNYTGSGYAISLGSGTNSSSSIQYSPYQLEGFTLTGGANMIQGVYVYPYVVNTLFRDLVLYNFGNALAWDVFYQSNNWYNVIDGAFVYASAGFGRAWNGIRLNGATATQQDNGTSRLNITNSILQNFDFATTPGIGVYLNGNQCSVTDSTIAGFGPHVQIGNYGHSVVLRHNWIETSHNLTGYQIVFGDPSGIGYGAWIGGVNISDNIFVPHATDYAPNMRPIGPVSATQVFNSLRLENNTVITLLTGTQIVTENNLSGYTNNFAQANMLMTCIACGTTPATGRIHTTGASTPAWLGPDGDGFISTGVNANGSMATFANGTNANGNVVFQVGSTAAQYFDLLAKDYNGNIIGGFEASGSGAGNRLSLLGPGNVIGAQVLSSGQLSVPVGFDAGGAGEKLIVNQAVGCTTAASVGATCTSPTISYSGTAFTNGSYALACTLTGITGVPTIAGTSKSTTGFTVTLAALTAAAATGNIDCVAIHW